LDIEYFLYRCFILLFPLIISGILHMVIVKMDILQSLKKPIYLKYFGRNKTYRGLAVMPFFCLLGIYLARSLDMLLPLNYQLGFNTKTIIPLGLLLGVSYILFELPNSFIKRRLGVPEGKPSPRFKEFFFILDRVDSGCGCALIYHFVFGIDLLQSFSAVILGIFIHFIIVYLLFLLKIRKEPY